MVVAPASGWHCGGKTKKWHNMDFLAAKWIWLYIGAFLMLAEIMAPGFVIFFFGLAAATIGLLLFVLPSGFELSLA